MFSSLYSHRKKSRNIFFPAGHFRSRSNDLLQLRISSNGGLSSTGFSIMPPLDPFPFVLGGWPFNGKQKRSHNLHILLQEHPQQQHQQDMHGCLWAVVTCVSMAAFGSATSGGTGSGSVGVLGFPGGVNLCLAVHGGDPPCDPTGSPLSIGTSTLIFWDTAALDHSDRIVNWFQVHDLPRTWYTRPVRDAVAWSGRTPFAEHADVPAGATGAGAGAIDTGASAVDARWPAEWHHRRPAIAPGQNFWLPPFDLWYTMFVSFFFFGRPLHRSRSYSRRVAPTTATVTVHHKNHLPTAS